MEFYITAVALFCCSGFGWYSTLTEGITGDPSLLMSKAVLDFFTTMIFAASLGKAICAIPLPQCAPPLLLGFLAPPPPPPPPPPHVGRSAGGRRPPPPPPPLPLPDLPPPLPLPSLPFLFPFALLQCAGGPPCGLIWGFPPFPPPFFFFYG